METTKAIAPTLNPSSPRIRLAVGIKARPQAIFKKNKSQIKIKFLSFNNSLILKSVFVCGSTQPSGFFKRKCPINIGIKYIPARIKNTIGNAKCAIKKVIIGLARVDANPKAQTEIPVASPLLSLNHNIKVLTGVKQPIPSPIPIKHP